MPVPTESSGTSEILQILTDDIALEWVHLIPCTEIIEVTGHIYENCLFLDDLWVWLKNRVEEATKIGIFYRENAGKMMID